MLLFIPFCATFYEANIEFFYSPRLHLINTVKMRDYYSQLDKIFMCESGITVCRTEAIFHFDQDIFQPLVPSAEWCLMSDKTTQHKSPLCPLCLLLFSKRSEMKPLEHVPESVTFGAVTSGRSHQYSLHLPQASHSGPH